MKQQLVVKRFIVAVQGDQGAGKRSILTPDRYDGGKHIDGFSFVFREQKKRLLENRIAPLCQIEQCAEIFGVFFPIKDFAHPSAEEIGKWRTDEEFRIFVKSDNSAFAIKMEDRYGILDL